jgi:hypothetical protein
MLTDYVVIEKQTSLSVHTLTFNNFSPAFLIMYGKVLLNSLRTCLLMSEIVTLHTFIFHQINIQIFIQYCIKKNPMTKQSMSFVRHLFLYKIDQKKILYNITVS